MNKNNVKLLTKEQIEAFKLAYEFRLDSEQKNVIVDCRNYTRKTYHDVNESFSLNSKIRKLTFWPEVIKAWIELYNVGKIYNLIDLQNAAMILYKSYQPYDPDNIKKYFRIMNGEKK